MGKVLSKIKNFIVGRKTNIYDLLILLALAALPFLFYGRYLIFNTMIDVCIDPLDFFKRLLYLWNLKEWTGTPFAWGSSLLFPFSSFFTFFSFLKLSAAVVERLWFIFILFQCGISMYYLAFVLFGEKYRLARLIAAVVYMYNLYVFIGLQGASVLLLPYAVAPLMLGLYIRGISSRDYLKFGILFGLTSTIMSFISPPLVVSNVIVLVLYSLYHIFVIEGKKGLLPVIKTAISSLLFSTVLNLWIILLIIYYLRSSYLVDISSIFSEKLSWINSGSSSLEIFRLLGIWYFFGYGAPGVPNFSYSALFKNNSFFIFLTFLLPILSLFALTIKRSNKYVSFFGLLILVAIPMAVGIYPSDNPSLTGKIYLWAYQKIPFFNIFKDNYRPFVAMIALSYSVLLGYLANFLFLHLKEKLSFAKQKLLSEAPKRFKFLSLLVRKIKSTFDEHSRIIRFLKDTRFKKIIPFVPPIFIISVILVISFPIINGNIFYEKMKIKQIPAYWYESAKWINDQKEDFRIFFLPEQRFALYFWGHTTGEISLSLYQKSQIFTVASIAERPNVDLINQIYRSISRNSTLDTAKIAGLMNIKYILQRNDYDWSLSVKEEPPEYAKSILESKENISFSKTFGQLDFYQVSNQYFLPHFYIPQNIVYSPSNIEVLSNILSFNDYSVRPGIYLGGIKESVPPKIDEIFVKGELENKITEEELGVEAKPEETVFPYVRQRPGSLLYPLVLKKEEYDKWKVRKEPEKLFEKHLFYASKRISEMLTFNIYSLTNYKKEMMDALGVLESLRQEKNKDFPKLLVKFEGVLWGHREKIEEMGKFKDWEITLADLERKINELKVEHDFSKLVYKLEVPKEGEYEIYLREEEIEKSRDLETEELKIDGKKVETNGDWVKLDERYFKEGNQELTLPLSGISENLIGEDLRIKDYSPDSLYRISFDYKAPRGGSFFVAEGKTGETTKTQLSPTGDEFSHFEMFFKSSSDVQEAAIHLSISVAEEKNLRIERIYQPELMLRMNADNTEKMRITPKITFVKINPTKYRVKVEGAKEPYTLVFSESFHQGWKVYINQTQNSNVKSQNYYGEEVVSYFNGEVKEGTHKNIFLNKATFETWGKKPIPEERHYLVNGYANSWYITPEDSEGAEDYDVIIEFQPQRLFYIGLFVSGITLIGCLGYLGITMLKRKFVFSK